MSNFLSSTTISELILTRMCHDIIGNTGAVANAVELLEEGDLDFLDDIKSILKTSSTVMNARLKFFRMAFGLSNANLQDPALVFNTARDYIATIGNKNYPIVLEMNAIDEKFVKFALTGIMIAADIMIKGGKIKVDYNNGKLVIVAENLTPQSADKAALIEQCLCAGNVEACAQLAPVFYLKELLKVSNYNLNITTGSHLVVTIS